MLHVREKVGESHEQRVDALRARFHSRLEMGAGSEDVLDVTQVGPARPHCPKVFSLSFSVGSISRYGRMAEGHIVIQKNLFSKNII